MNNSENHPSSQSCLDATRRESTLAEIQSQTFDVIVIGGGITGAGILRDASLRGLSVALIEAHDFSGGTSSKSTKLIHGGLRYLAMGHVHIVREAARERKRVNRIAPHLAEPKWLTLPARNRLEWLKYKIGVAVYEKLGQVADKDRHFDVSGESLAAHEPLIDRDAYPYACVYREYLTDDSRLVLGNIRAGVKAGGVAVNQLAVTGLLKDYGKVTGVRAVCALGGQEIVLRSKAVINAAGPWVEQICNLDGLPSPKSLALSKGVHIVLPRDRLPLSQMVLSVTDDKRPVFFIPRNQVVYVGTTDTAYDHANLWPEVLEEEVAYLLKPVRDYLGASFVPTDCLGTWAGLRPLISQRGKSTKEISRKDEIWTSASGMITIAGGKLTGYRKMAEDTVDVACAQIAGGRPDYSEDTPLPGGDFPGDVADLALNLTQSYPMPDERALRLVSLYGTESRDVLALDSRVLVAGGQVVRGEVSWAVHEEGAQTVEDVLYRRVRATYYAPVESSALIEPIARMMAQSLGWSAEREQAEIDGARLRLGTDLAATKAA